MLRISIEAAKNLAINYSCVKLTRGSVRFIISPAFNLSDHSIEVMT